MSSNKTGRRGPGKEPGTSSGPDEGGEQGEIPLRETVVEWVREAMAAERKRERLQSVKDHH